MDALWILWTDPRMRQFLWDDLAIDLWCAESDGPRYRLRYYTYG